METAVLHGGPDTAEVSLAQGKTPWEILLTQVSRKHAFPLNFLETFVSYNVTARVHKALCI